MLNAVFASRTLHADADMVIDSHAAWQYQMRPKAKCGTAVSSVDIFQDLWKQWR